MTDGLYVMRFSTKLRLRTQPNFHIKSTLKDPPRFYRGHTVHSNNANDPHLGIATRRCLRPLLRGHLTDPLEICFNPLTAKQKPIEHPFEIRTSSGVNSSAIHVRKTGQDCFHYQCITQELDEQNISDC